MGVLGTQRSLIFSLLIQRSHKQITQNAIRKYVYTGIYRTPISLGDGFYNSSRVPYNYTIGITTSSLSHILYRNVSTWISFVQDHKRYPEIFNKVWRRRLKKSVSLQLIDFVLCILERTFVETPRGKNGSVYINTNFLLNIVIRSCRSPMKKNIYAKYTTFCREKSEKYILPDKKMYVKYFCEYISYLYKKYMSYILNIFCT